MIQLWELALGACNFRHIADVSFLDNRLFAPKKLYTDFIYHKLCGSCHNMPSPPGSWPLTFWKWCWSRLGTTCIRGSMVAVMYLWYIWGEFQADTWSGERARKEGSEFGTYRKKYKADRRMRSDVVKLVIVQRCIFSHQSSCGWAVYSVRCVSTARLPVVYLHYGSFLMYCVQ